MLCLSGRMFEHGGKIAPLERFLKVASELGYEGVELRGGHLSASSSPAEVTHVAQALKKYRLECAFLTAPEPVDEATLELAQTAVKYAHQLGAYGIRTAVTSLDYIAGLKALARFAAAEDVKVFAQLHERTLLADTASAKATLEAIAHTNFGLAFEPSHLLFAGVTPEETPKALAELLPWVMCVSVQNHKPWLAGHPSPKLTLGGRDWSLALPEDRQGVPWLEVFRALKKANYKGPIVAMPALYPRLSPEAYADHYLRIMRAFWRG